MILSSSYFNNNNLAVLHDNHWILLHLTKLSVYCHITLTVLKENTQYTFTLIIYYNILLICNYSITSL